MSLCRSGSRTTLSASSTCCSETAMLNLFLREITDDRKLEGLAAIRLEHQHQPQNDDGRKQEEGIENRAEKENRVDGNRDDEHAGEKHRRLHRVEPHVAVLLLDGEQHESGDEAGEIRDRGREVRIEPGRRARGHPAFGSANISRTWLLSSTQ